MIIFKPNTSSRVEIIINKLNKKDHILVLVSSKKSKVIKRLKKKLRFTAILMLIQT